MSVEWVMRSERARQPSTKGKQPQRSIVLVQRRCWVCEESISWVSSETACSDRCRRLLYAESYRIDRIREESRRKGYQADITLEQWARAIRIFNGRCAYCQQPFDTCDHVMPRHRGGPSTSVNLVPACFSCNTIKGGRLLDEVDDLTQEGIARVRNYVQCG